MIKRRGMATLMMLLAGLALASLPADAREKNVDAGRLLTGRVADKQDAPLPDSVVYLTNTRNRAVKTFIVGPDGKYRFPALSPNVDYEVYAQYKDHKSDTKTVSQFDTRPTVNINLKIDMK
ncbi:MAG: carboxypeptidase-like regulatory domain-containing protein [Terriglobales bacterium]